MLLYLACREKNGGLALDLIEEDIRYVDYVSDTNSSVLMCACANGLSGVALKIIDLGVVDCNMLCVCHNTNALIMSVVNGMDEVCMRLLNDTDLCVYDLNGCTALHHACINRNTKIALEMLKVSNCNYSKVNKNGCLALHYACEGNMTEVALEIIRIDKKAVGEVNEVNCTPLIWACSNRMDEVALRLIDTGYSSPHITDDNGNDALIFACMKSMEEVSMKLIDVCNMNLLHRNNSGISALDYAIKKNMKTVVSRIMVKICGSPKSNSSSLSSSPKSDTSSPKYCGSIRISQERVLQIKEGVAQDIHKRYRQKMIDTYYDDDYDFLCRCWTHILKLFYMRFERKLVEYTKSKKSARDIIRDELYRYDKDISTIGKTMSELYPPMIMIREVDTLEAKMKGESKDVFDRINKIYDEMGYNYYDDLLRCIKLHRVLV